MNKGPSLDAIRKFKEQQERKKREEDEKKVKEKLSTLKHRASRGDRKAKQELRKIEKIKEERNKAPEVQTKVQGLSIKGKKSFEIPRSSGSVPKRPQRQETDFEELMKLAKQNANEIKEPPQSEEPKTAKLPIVQKKERNLQPEVRGEAPQQIRVPQPRSNRVIKNNRQQQERPQPQSASVKARKQQELQKRIDLDKRVQLHKQKVAMAHRGYDPYCESGYGDRGRMNDYEDKDEYESDDFVVDEGDDFVQDEVSRTIRSVFRYDKRRCDLREEELDRQYRAIGKVSTFEDLEREERRASRLAAAEDAQAFKEEEERKRQKRLRLQKS